MESTFESLIAAGANVNESSDNQYYLEMICKMNTPCIPYEADRFLEQLKPNVNFVQKDGRPILFSIVDD